MSLNDHANRLVLDVLELIGKISNQQREHLEQQVREYISKHPEMGLARKNLHKAVKEGKFNVDD